MSDERRRVHPCDVAQEAFTATRVKVVDCDGNELGMLPTGFTDEQLLYIVDFANEFYAAGVRVGRLEAQEEMRAALGLTK